MHSSAAQRSSRGVALAIRGLNVAYGPVQAVADVDLVGLPAAVTAIVGANGAGKTTLLSAVAGLVPASSGSIDVGGEDVTGWPSHRRVRHGTVLVPEGRQIFERMTVQENVQLGAWACPTGLDHSELDYLLSIFPVLRARWNQRAGNLSGGEQQMLAMVRALIAKPRLLLLDEPSLGLSPRLVSEVFESLRRLRDRGVTMVLVEQNAAAALAMADKAYVMETGSVVAEGTGKELLSDESVIEAYLGINDGS